MRAAIAALPPGTLGPFGSWAGGFGNADFCLRWPGPTGDVPFGPGPLPDVPMLAVSGAFDMRTPTVGAQSVVSRFPQGHLLVVPGVGHSTVTADPSGCAVNAVRSWMLDQPVPTTCPATKPLVVSRLGAPGARAGESAARAVAALDVRDREAVIAGRAGALADDRGRIGRPQRSPAFTAEG